MAEGSDVVGSVTKKQTTTDCAMDQIEFNLDNFRKEQYEMQLFGYSIADLIEYVQEMMDEQITSGISSMEKCLLGKCSKPGAEKIQEATKVLRKDYDKARSCCNLQELANKYFAIPNNVLLPEDAMQMNQYTEEDEKRIDKEIEELQKRTKRVFYMKTCLSKEKRVLKKIEELEANFNRLEEQLYTSAKNTEQLSHNVSLETLVKKILNLKQSVETENTWIHLESRFRDTDFLVNMKNC